MTQRGYLNGPLLIALFATLCLIAILSPMRSVVMWSFILTVLFANVNERLVAQLGTRNRASTATVLLILALAVVPALILCVLIADQVGLLIENSDEIAARAQELAGSVIDKLPASMQTNLTGSIDFDAQRAGNVVMSALGYTASIGGNVASFVGTILAILYVTFFFLRDRVEIARYLSRLIPLHPNQKAELKQRMTNTVMATVRGVFLVALAQSFAAGVIYWLLGLKTYAVLAGLTFVGCFLPAVGSGLVWVPVSIYFFLTGDVTRGIIMVASGVLVISMVDNILRPKLIGKGAGLPEFLIFLSSIGGLMFIGFDGLFLGPIIAGFCVASWNVYIEFTSGAPQVTEEPPPPVEGRT